MIMMKGLQYMNFEDLNTYHQLAFYRILNDISSGMAFVDICSGNDEILDLFYSLINESISVVYSHNDEKIMYLYGIPSHAEDKPIEEIFTLD